MAIAATFFDSTPATVVADMKAKILLSSDWANITGNIVKATTTRGAQMVIDLADAAATSTQMQLGIYRTHNGTTGVDKLVRYLNWQTNGSAATSDPLHCFVSAGPDHIYISIEGPRAGEAHPVDGTRGSWRVYVSLSDITPYFVADTIPAVVLAGASPTNGSQMTSTPDYKAYVSRNQADTASWVPAKLGTIANANGSGNWSNDPKPTWVSAQPTASDGNFYLWPYLVIEDTAGLRGRVSRFFNGGATGIGTGATDVNGAPFAKYTYSGVTYMLFPALLSAGTSAQLSPYGYIAPSTLNSILLAVPVA